MHLYLIMGPFTFTLKDAHAPGARHTKGGGATQAGADTPRRLHGPSWGAPPEYSLQL